MPRRAAFTLPGTLAALLVAALLASRLGPAARAQFPEQEPANGSLVFGCQPGPIEPFYHEDPPLPADVIPDEDGAAREAGLTVEGYRPGQPLAGAGFNLEHTLWSCPTFRPSLRRRLLEPLRPAIVRVDSGQLPLVPDDVPAELLGWSDYQAQLAADRYQPSWELIRRLNRQNVRVLLGVWGAPGAFTDDGTRRGALLPEHFDHYVEYYVAVVDYLVRDRGLTIWAATVMNEPDGGDGTAIAPDDLAELARRLGPRLAPYGVKLYAPDTASAERALDYLDPLLDDPTIVEHLGAIATHQYYPSTYLDELVNRVRTAPGELPVYVTEYTSFDFGELDRGEQADDEVGFMLDVATTLTALYNSGADAALYWDAVDYYQAGHAAITAWGLLRGPADAFFPRKRYFGLLQILPYLQPGSTILRTRIADAPELAALAIHTPGDGVRDVAVVLVNRGGALTLHLDLRDLPDVDSLEVYLTDDDHNAELQGRLPVPAGRGQLYLPARSIVTLAPAAAPDE